MTERPSRPRQEQLLRRPLMQQVARREDERLNRERRRLAHPWRHRLFTAAIWAMGLLAAGLVAYFFVGWLTAGAVPAGGAL
jgi:hypothetical protein